LIRAAVLEGARSVGVAEVREIGARQHAIATAIAEASTGDCVIILGKGHETGQEVAGVVTHFDDREVALEAIQERLG
jgi:UDP-N-acetylmuramoyl-L-alanyl-D-glutamate--2,6-diaminopimelate ligase